MPGLPHPSACGQPRGTAEPGSPPPMPSLKQAPPPTPTLTLNPTPTPAQSPLLPDRAGTSAGAAEGQELQHWRQGASGGAGIAGPGGGSGAAAGARKPPSGSGEARRRLLEVEGRRRLVSELESRVLQLHRVFLAAELRLAHRAESLSRLSGGVAQAELYLAAHGSPAAARRGRPPAPGGLRAYGLGGCVPGGGRPDCGRRTTAPPSPDAPVPHAAPPRGPASPQR
uniref:TMF1 regulated nuclear protein 1 n=1 Tax=Aotus nancymaae TaxID=37293 RepID=A0A2K5E6R7_AOTNA